MKFPNAAKGVSKIFTSEILSIIGAIFVGIASIVIVGAVQAGSDKVLSESTAAGTAIGGGLFAIVGGIIVLIAAIMMLVGIIQAAKDEEYFKTALYVMIADVIIVFVMNIITNASDTKEYFSAGNTIVELFVAIYVVKGIINLANKLNNSEVASKGLLIIKSLILVFVLEIIARFFSAFTHNKVAQAISIALAIAIIVISVIKYIIYLSLLSKAKKMLAE